MLVLIGAITLVSLALNILIYNKVRNPQIVEIVVERLKEDGLEEPEVLSEPEPQITVPMVQEVYQGWRNQTNIPLYEGEVKPLPPIKQDDRGPLQRPQGFV